MNNVYIKKKKTTKRPIPSENINKSWIVLYSKHSNPTGVYVRPFHWNTTIVIIIVRIRYHTHKSGGKRVRKFVVLVTNDNTVFRNYCVIRRRRR